MTRTRYLTKNGDMDFKQKNSPSKTSKDYIPWYEYPNRKTASDKVVFGHWSTLGLIDYPNAYCLDTGCLWGGSLTAMSLDGEHEYISVDSPLYVSPF